MSDESTFDEPTNSGLTANKADGVSPGEILREGRLAHDYSVDDLCAQTKLTSKTIEALEDNDFDALSQPVFARGYYRQCAKVLDLDMDRLMAAYTAWAGEPAKPRVDYRAASGGTIPQDVTPGGSRFLRGLLILVVVAVVAAIAVVFFLPNSGLSDSDSVENQVEPNTGNTTVSVTDNASNTSDASATADEPDDSVNASNETQGLASAPDATQDSQSQTSSRSGRQSGGRNVNHSLGMDNTDETGAEDRPTASDAEGDDRPNDGSADRLIMTFSDRSWVRVTDANGNRMASGIFESGDKQVFEGTPPYNIRLGYAPGVSIAIGGQSVDVSAQTDDGGVANLTVDTPADNG